LSAQQVVLSKAPAWRGRMGLPAGQAVTLREIATANHAAETPLWQPALELAQALLKQQAPKGASLQVILGGRLVRWLVMEWDPALTRAEERLAVARLRFQQVYGTQALAWQVTLPLQAPGCATLACAVDKALIDALQETSRSMELRLKLVTPYFASAIDRYLPRERASDFWFGLVEPDHLTLGLVCQGQWRQLRSQRLQHSLQSTLQSTMTQMYLSAGLETAPARLLLAGQPPAANSPFTLPCSWLPAGKVAAAQTAAQRMVWGV
jgi:hypothetical protein